MMNKAVFIDKDGTLIKNLPYNVDPALISLEDFCIEGLQHIQKAGYLLIIVSNQSGVAMGYFKEEALIAVKERIRELLAEHQLNLDGFYYCPNHPDGMVKEYAIDCDLRKPKPGLILRAAAEHQIDLSESWMIGDILHDIEAGHRAGCKAILINNGNETEWIMNEYNQPDYIAKHINDAATQL